MHFIYIHDHRAQNVLINELPHFELLDNTSIIIIIIIGIIIIVFIIITIIIIYFFAP